MEAVNITNSRVIENVAAQNRKRVIYIALCFMTLFTAYCSGQNLISQIYSQLGYGKLGQICLFCVWTFQGLISLVANYYKKKISTQTGLIAGALCHVSLIVAGVWTTYCEGKESALCSTSFVTFLNVSCAISVGIGAAFLWLGQATYVNECADEKTKGIFTGMFWSIFQTAQILSSILATLILGFADQFTFYIILVFFGLASIGLLYYIQDPVKDPSKPEAPAAQDDNETLAESLQKFKDLFGEQKCYFLFQALLFSGIAIGCYINFLGAFVTPTVGSDDVNVINKSVGFVLMFLAFGEVAAGLSMGRLADMYDKIKLFTVTMYINEAALFVSLLACLFRSYPLAILCGLLWGYGDTAIQTMINAVIGSVFNGRVELFSAYRFFQSIGLVYSSVLAIMIPRDMPFLYILAVAGSLMAFHILYYRYIPRTTKRSQDFLLNDEQKIIHGLKNF